MTEEIKTKPLNKELLRCFVLIVLSIAVLTIAMIVSVFNPQILIIGAVIGTIEVFLVIFCVYRLFRFLYKEISLKIAKISEETTKLSRYVYAIDRGMGEFAKGNLTARGNIKFLGDFASIQNSILVFADKIKDAIEKIRGGVNDISEMVLTSSAASQENAAASEELATQSQLLKELIENFKVDE